jgi:tetratricopeptide (TPR) repeat protein
LTAHGYDVFFDYQSLDSEDFSTAILENIQARAHFLVILSPSALERCGQPEDRLRREIETTLDENHNIVPLMMEGFDFGSPATVQALTGKLASLKAHNGLRLYADYFFDAMEKLRTRFLYVAVAEMYPHAVSQETTQTNLSNKATADEAASVEVVQLTAEEWLERGYVFQNAKYYAEALRCYHEAIRINAEIHAAYNNLGNLYSDLNRYTEAEAAYRKAIELNPFITTVEVSLV